MVRFGRWGVAGKGANDSSISFRQATSPAPLQYLPSKRPVPTSSPATTLWPIAAKTQMAEKIEMDNLLFMEVSPISLLSAHLEFNFGEFRAGQMHGPALRVDQCSLRVRLRIFRANRAVSRPISRRSRGRHCELLLTHRFITDKKDGGQHQLPAHAGNGGFEPPRGQGDGASEPSLNVVIAYQPNLLPAHLEFNFGEFRAQASKRADDCSSAWSIARRLRSLQEWPHDGDT